MTKHVKPSRLSICRWFVAVALGCLALNSFAAVPIPKGGRQPFSVETQNGNLQVYSVMGTAHSGTYFKNPSVSRTSPSVSSSVPMPFANKGGTSSDATLIWPVKPEVISSESAKALEAGLAGLSSGNGYVALASVACAFVCEPLIKMLLDEGASAFKSSEDGVLISLPSSDLETSDGYSYRVANNNNTTSISKADACAKDAQIYVLNNGPLYRVEEYIDTVGSCTYSYFAGVNRYTNSKAFVRVGASNCPSGHYVQNGLCISPDQAPTTDKPLTSYLDSNYTGKGWNHHWAGITAGLVAAGVNVFTDGTGSTITGPAVVPVSTSETKTPINLSPGTTTPAPPGSTGPTDSGTQTTTTTTTAHNTYRPGSSGSGPSMETKTQTQTTTNITNNITNNTSSTVITNTTETDKAPEKEEKDFCEQNPDSVACAETDTPEQETPTGNLNISYEYVDIFGNGSCPSDSYLNTHGQSLKVWDWAATCDNVQSYFRPILIACCAFAAFVIVSAGAKE